MSLVNMKLCIVLTLAIAVAYVRSQELSEAKPCDPEACKLPTCRCSSSEIPGGLRNRDTPQFVILTFDDAVTVTNIPTYRSLTYGRKNKNNCPAGVTFFTSHAYTDYSLVNELYNQGFEIGLHSITHVANQEYWRDATTDVLLKEFEDQKQQMVNFAMIPESEIRGIRSPFLQLAGNATYEMMAKAGFRYDLSWPTSTYTDPGMWPYTLDYASTQDCFIPPCPTASIPGPWVLPIVSWTDLEGFKCAFVDACPFSPGREDEEGWFRFILTNFERHYFGNRAPFGFYIHEGNVRSNPALQRGLERFLDTINNLYDVFMVTANEVIDWVQNPVPINEYVKQPCRSHPPAPCPRPTNCGPYEIADIIGELRMGTCSRCPRNYPWVNNPLGN